MLYFVALCGSFTITQHKNLVTSRQILTEEKHLILRSYNKSSYQRKESQRYSLTAEGVRTDNESLRNPWSGTAVSSQRLKVNVKIQRFLKTTIKDNQKLIQVTFDQVSGR